MVMAPINEKEQVDATVHAENAENQRRRITHSQIDNTLYIVESVQSSSATETVGNKLKRLILSNAARS